jgi:rhodanese-related sulfurtransferase
MRHRWLAVLCLPSCVSQVPFDAPPAAEAIERYERHEIIVVDIRSAAEVLSAFPKHALIQIQFGPDQWGSVTEEQVAAFIRRLAPFMSGGSPVFLLCQYGVRSETASRLLARRGLSVTNIKDGYLGNSYGPGWRAWE